MIFGAAMGLVGIVLYYTEEMYQESIWGMYTYEVGTGNYPYQIPGIILSIIGLITIICGIFLKYKKKIQ